ncbi:hypothetical protein R3P38DRAFT_2775818 [Favolaschia claudopus]|uniref:Uncharacterized protein n=1 Tax=Favolaschia claudopus TaxID=2862362 RepID=A0AAW0BR63_9AGAR
MSNASPFRYQLRSSGWGAEQQREEPELLPRFFGSTIPAKETEEAEKVTKKTRKEAKKVERAEIEEKWKEMLVVHAAAWERECVRLREAGTRAKDLPKKPSLKPKPKPTEDVSDDEDDGSGSDEE